MFSGFGQLSITQHSVQSQKCGVPSVFQTVNGKTVTTPCVRVVCGSKTVSTSCCSTCH